MLPNVRNSSLILIRIPPFLAACAAWAAPNRRAAAAARSRASKPGGRRLPGKHGPPTVGSCWRLTWAPSLVEALQRGGDPCGRSLRGAALGPLPGWSSCSTWPVTPKHRLSRGRCCEEACRPGRRARHCFWALPGSSGAAAKARLSLSGLILNQVSGGRTSPPAAWCR